ncbi:hypothetical protein MYP_3117 [Sporocytophaga myxococcoides]|uniref:Uncharacterized protein n=1 Tax=Sporocytophaga myxococcoides TaxID=153721 RepID=A0A098LIE2_9BACT|nr:hypothetical protein [Sporocytophaga myxococcoides]GAL85888.1 hypothetical protein MYP_3117 [Sporocytophaga myxococcoides]
MKKLILFILAFLLVCVNFILPYVSFDHGINQRNSLIYLIINEDYREETLIALTAFYPLVSVILYLIFKDISGLIYGKILLFIWGVAGILSAILLWLIMNLHLDVKIVSYNFSYYSILIAQVGISLITIIFALLPKKVLKPSQLSV